MPVMYMIQNNLKYFETWTIIMTYADVKNTPKKAYLNYTGWIKTPFTLR